MTEAPERIWACMSGPMVGLFVSGGNNGGWPEYVRADAAHAELEALDPDAVARIRADALREAAEAVKPHMSLYHTILALIQKEKDDE